MAVAFHTSLLRNHPFEVLVFAMLFFHCPMVFGFPLVQERFDGLIVLGIAGTVLASRANAIPFNRFEKTDAVVFLCWSKTVDDSIPGRLHFVWLELFNVLFQYNRRCQPLCLLMNGLVDEVRRQTGVNVKAAHD